MVKFIFILILKISIASPLFAAEVLLDKIVATINGDPILYSEIQEKITKGPLIAITDYPAGPGAKEWDRALNDKINFKLMLQAANDLKISVDDLEIDQQIDRFIAQQNTKLPPAERLTKAKLYQLLDKEGKSLKQYREDFANQIKLQRFQAQKIMPTVKVTDEELESYYHQIATNKDQNFVYDLHKIFVEADINKANSIYQEAIKNKDFAEVAKKHNNNNTDSFLKGIKLRDLAESVANGVRDLKVGDISKPIKTTAGIFIFKVLARNVSKDDVQFDSVKDRLRQEIQTKELISATHTWIDDQRKISKIEIR